MKWNRQYRLALENESRLTTLIDKRFKPIHLWLGGAVVIALLLLIAGVVVMVTPLHTLLPGYLKASQRAATQEGMLKLDSLSQAMERNQTWIDNVMTVTNTDRRPTDSAAHSRPMTAYDPEDLADPSPMEKRFVSAMEERERFNISVLAPLDADGMIFSPVAGDALVTADSRQSLTATFLLPSESPVQAVADGVVVGSFIESPRAGYTLIVQHGRGFISTYYHLGNPLVSVGDAVNAGQSIAFPPAPDSRNSRWIKLRMWYNGTSVIPYDMLGTSI